MIMDDVTNTMMKHYRLQALEDLSHRSKRGIFLLPLIWLMLVIPYQIQINSPQFFYLNLSVFIAFIVIRLRHLLIIGKQSALNVDKMLDYFIMIVVAIGLHWGLMAAWVMYAQEYEKIRYFMLIITPSLSIGAALTFSICNKIRILLPLVMNVPITIVLLLNNNLQNALTVILLLLAIIYSYLISDDLHDDYWDAVKTNQLVEKRAKVMEMLSITDPLTQVKNRLFFNQQLNEEWGSGFLTKKPLSIMILDLDYFKKINDNYGHSFGDEFLKTVAQTLNKELIRETDSMARYGGEEFVFLLPNTDEKNATKVANRLLRAIENIELNYEGNKVTITCSIGGSTVIPCLDEKEDYLLKKADNALYQAKNNGRNQYFSLNASC